MQKQKKKWSGKDKARNTSTLTSKSYSYEQLLQALYGVQDLFERARAQFFLDRDTLVQVNNHLELDGDRVTVGVKRAELTEGAREVMQSYMPAHSWTDSDIQYIISNVPVHIKIYPNDIVELTNPETVVYAYETFNIPNPVKTFLQKDL